MYLARNTKYPPLAKENNVQGSAYVSFVINEKEKVIDVSILKGADYKLDKEAARMLEPMSSWILGKQRGKVVKVCHQVPIVFKLF